MKGLKKKARKLGLNFGEQSLGWIALGFITVILLGSILLSLPIATITRKSIGWFDALFESTSAVCVTGLVVRDTGTTFSIFGKFVLICLIQVGGLGFMTFAMILMRIMRRRITLAERLMLRDAAGSDGIGDAIPTIKWIAKSAFLVEFCGALVLMIRFIPKYGILNGIGYSVFHAISAFCNAGFDLFGGYNSLSGFRADVLINLTAIGLVVIGGIGFSVIREVIGRFKHKHKRLTAYARIVLVSYFSLLAFGWIFTLIAEWNNPGTLGELPFGEKLLAGLFQSMTLRTAGFNTIDEGALRPVTKFVSCVLMVIGCAPASTGGGIKVTTASVILITVFATARGEEHITVRHSTIPRETVRRALAVAMLALGVLMFDTVMISLIQPELEFMDVLFECASAIGTVGISAFGSASLSTIPRLLIIITMYLGRIGPLSAAIVLAKRGGGGADDKLRYPDAHIMIG